MRSYIRIIIHTFIFIVIGAINVSAQNRYEVISNSRLNIRSQPNSKATILGALSPKSQIDVIKIVEGWAEFEYNNQSAFVSSKYLVKINVAEKAELFKVISTSHLNVRNRPSTNSLVIGTLQLDTQIEVLSITEYWAKIRYNNNVGYVSTKYITKVESNSTIKHEDELTEEAQQEEIKTVSKEITILKNEESNLLNHIGIEFVPNVYFGFSNFSVSDISAKGSIGCGIDLSFQFIAKERINFIPKNYFSEISMGYSMKGSAAFPMHYISVKLLPFGYRYNLPKFSLYGKLGIYTGFSFSSIETNRNSFDSNVDVGLTFNIGAEYNKIGLGILYERGFTNVCNSNLSLKNSCVFFNLSYRLFSLK